MRIVKNEEAVSPVIGVILMVAITVILAAVIAAFVFNLGGSQEKAPTASITVANNPDTTIADLKIQHKGGDTLKGGDWKISVAQVGSAPLYNVSAAGNDLAVGAQLSINGLTGGTPTVMNSTGVYNTTGSLTTSTKYDVKLVHVPSNAMLLDTVVEVR